MEPNQPLEQEFKPFYERGYSNLHRLLILFVFAAVGLLLGAAVSALIAKTQGMSMSDLTSGFGVDSSSGERNTFRFIALANHFFGFLIPGILAAWLFYKKDWQAYLRIDGYPMSKYLGLGALMIILAFPFAQLTYWLNSMLPIPDALMSMEEDTAELVKGLLVMDSPVELIFNLVVIALIPAIAEEIIFRGVVQSTFENIFENPHYAVWAAAIVFSFIHMQFEGFLPRVVLGLVLGYLFYWTRNLWVPILAHFVNNGLQVVAAYFMPEKMEALEPDAMSNSVIISGVISLALTIFIGRYIIKTVNEQKDKERLFF